MNFIATIKSSSIANKIRSIIGTLFSANDGKQAQEVAPYGYDAPPVPGIQALYLQTSNRSQPVFVGYINTNQLAAPGECRIYATDATGAEVSRIWQHTNGDIEIGGTGAASSNVNHLVQWEALNTALSTAQTQINANFTALYGALGIVPVPPVSLDITTSKTTKILIQ